MEPEYPLNICQDAAAARHSSRNESDRDRHANKDEDAVGERRSSRNESVRDRPMKMKMLLDL